MASGSGARFGQAWAWATLVAGSLLTGACSQAPQPTVAPAPATTATAAPAEPSASMPPGAMGANVEDIDVTTNVKTALQRSETLKGFDISVVTLKGDVRLIGMLDSQAQVDEALTTARAAAGTHSIHDELTLRK